MFLQRRAQLELGLLKFLGQFQPLSFQCVQFLSLFPESGFYQFVSIPQIK